MNKYNDENIINEEDLNELEVKIVCPKCGAFMRRFADNDTYWVCESCTYEFDELEEDVC